MITLAIETSCDETGVAIVESKNPLHHRVLVNLLASQVTIHKRYGGVVPSLAAREHVKNLPLLIKKAIVLQKNLTIDAIAYTDGPGLEPALLVGRTFAKTFGYVLGIPAYPVNHLYGHLFSCLAGGMAHGKSQISHLFPAIGLVISGGHTQLYYIESFQKIELMGGTLDDAIGEALDKGARLLGLPYPGGPEIEKLAKKGKKNVFTFPSPMASSSTMNFSFSGLKTALLYKIRELQKSEKKIDRQTKADLARAYQDAAFKSLDSRVKRALAFYKARALFIGGGVIANTLLRERLKHLIRSTFPHCSLYIPQKQFATDNAVMIALAYSLPALS